MQAVEGGEVTFSVDLTVASAGEWFLDGQALKTSSVFEIRSDGTWHMLTIREVPASLHGAQLKFVANGIESSIRMEVRGRCRVPAWDPEPYFSRVGSVRAPGRAATGLRAPGHPFSLQVTGMKQTGWWSCEDSLRLAGGTGPWHLGEGLGLQGSCWAEPHVCLPPSLLSHSSLLSLVHLFPSVSFLLLSCFSLSLPSHAWLFHLRLHCFSGIFVTSVLPFSPLPASPSLSSRAVLLGPSLYLFLCPVSVSPCLPFRPFSSVHLSVPLHPFPSGHAYPAPSGTRADCPQAASRSCPGGAGSAARGGAVAG